MTVVAIGNFDGVHLGHQAVLRRAREAAQGPLIVITFWPHPVGVLRPDKAPKLITDLHTRIELLRAAGADEVRVVRFNDSVATMTPEEFVDDFLRPLRPDRVVVGHNFRFGARAAGDVAALARLGAGTFEVDEVPLSEEDGAVICSTAIREAVAQGDVEAAARMLGRPLEFRGLVVVGDRRGRDLGFPTANVVVPEGRCVPTDGVYAGWVTRIDVPGGTPMPAAISVGSNPTFDGMERRVESYVLDRDDLSLYGVQIAVDFVARLRGQVRFDGVDGLITQMHEDVARTRQVLAVHPTSRR